MPRKPKSTPDWAAFRRKSRFGGTLRECPAPRIRYFSPDNPEAPLRKVTISVTIFWGIGHHYYVTIREEDNPIWDSKEKTWAYPWKDIAGQGRQFTKRANNVVDAQAFIRKTIKQFPSTTHFIHHDSEEVKKIWFGKFKEGD